MAQITKFTASVSLAFLCISLLICCSESKEVDIPPPDPTKPSLTVTQALPTAPFGAQGGSASLVFSTNESWRITSETAPESDADAATWYDITPLSGDAGEDISIKVTVDPNEEYAGRAFTLVLSSESLEKRIEVTQLKKNAIIVGENRLEVSSGEQTLTVEVQSNVEYGIHIKQGEDWITEAPESRAGGLKREEHVFTISANPDAQERTGTIVFQDDASDLFDELTVVQAAWEDPDPERSALKAVYDAAGGGAWTHNDNWCSNKPLGEWYGVETDGDGNVTALRLPKNNLAGTVSWDIAKLTKLRHLDLSQNSLSGDITTKEGSEIVSYLDDLLELETINLSHNSLTGQFMPVNCYKMERLQYLNLSSNRLKCSAIPIKWEAMFISGRTVDLILNNNSLYGKVPDVIQNHPDWSRLALQFLRQSRDNSGGIDYDKEIQLPNFTFTDLRDGSQRNIRDVYSGNTQTMILHWNPLEADSKIFMETAVRRVHTLFSGQGFAVVAITPEGEEYKQAAEQYLREHDAPYPVVADYADAQGRRAILPSEPYPSYFLVDQYGKVSNDMFTGQYCMNALYPEEPVTADLIERPLQHAENLNKVFKTLFGNSTYQSTDFSMDKQFETLQRATKGKGIDIVLLGEAFTDVDIASGYYKQVMEFAMESFFAIEPTKSYREYFNIHMVYAVSRDAFIAKSGGNTALGVEIENSYQWYFINTAVRQLPDYYRVAATDGVYIPTVGVVINGAGGGVTQMQSYVIGPNYAFTGFSGRRSFREDFIHETVGHGFGLLGDEYTRLEAPFLGEMPESEKKRLRSEQNKGWYLNLSLTNDPKSVNWSHLIGHSRYPYISMYEGGYYYGKGVWKSESCTLMSSQSDYYFNTICRELIVKRTMEWSGEEYTFEKFLAKDSDAGRRKSSTPTSRQTNAYESERRHQPPIISE